MDVGKVVIEKLNGDNYLVWATQMQELLQAKDSWKYVDGDEVITTPKNPSSKPNNESAKEKSIARAMIICCI